MKPVLLLLFCTFVFVLPVTNTLNAQTDTTNKIQVDTTTVANAAASAPDDEFNLFLLTFGAAFLCAIIIASFIGALGALIIIGFVFAMTSAGIISTSFIVGFYKKSCSRFQDSFNNCRNDYRHFFRSRWFMDNCTSF